jgi:electron transfer flavoprotein beta subunit
MKVLVCVKQVPELDSPLKIENRTVRVQSDEMTDFRMNRLDEFAVEEAVLIKETYSNTKIDAISVGPDRSAEVIKRSIGMGADTGIHLITDFKGYQSSFEIAAWIAEYAKEMQYDLVLTGAMSEDNMQGQVGPMLAKRLNLPCATAVIAEKLAPGNKTIYVEREIEGGRREELELLLPAVLTIQSGINTPRYPSLSKLLRANRLKLERIHIGDLGRFSSGETIVQMVYPSKTRTGMVLSGSGEDKAIELIRILREKALLP